MIVEKSVALFIIFSLILQGLSFFGTVYIGNRSPPANICFSDSVVS